MIRVNLTDELKERAKKENFITSDDYEKWHHCYAGLLAELIVAQYFNCEWKPKGERDVGVDIYVPHLKLRVQVKSTVDHPSKKKIFLENKADKDFDSYALCLVSQDMSYVDIFLIGERKFVELNCSVDEDGRKFIYYR